MATLQLSKNEKRLPTTLQVNLRSLNLREDIFDARYRSTNARLSNDWKEGGLGLQGKQVAAGGAKVAGGGVEGSTGPASSGATSPQQRALRVINIDLKNFSRRNDQLRRSMHNDPQPFLLHLGADAALSRGQQLARMQSKGEHFLQTQTLQRQPMPAQLQGTHLQLAGGDGELNPQRPVATPATYAEASKTNTAAPTRNETGYADASGAQWISVRNQNYLPLDMQNGDLLQHGEQDGHQIYGEGPYSMLRHGQMRAAVEMPNRGRVQTRSKRRQLVKTLKVETKDLKGQEAQRDGVSPIYERTQDDASGIRPMMASKAAGPDLSRMSRSPVESGVPRNKRSDLFQYPQNEDYLLRLSGIAGLHSTAQRSEEYERSPTSIDVRQSISQTKGRDKEPTLSDDENQKNRVARQQFNPRNPVLKTADCSQELKKFEGYSNWHQFNNASLELMRVANSGPGGVLSYDQTAGVSTALIPEGSLPQNQFAVQKEALPGDAKDDLEQAHSGQVHGASPQQVGPESHGKDAVGQKRRADFILAGDHRDLGNNSDLKIKQSAAIKVMHQTSPSDMLNTLKQENALASRAVGAQNRQNRIGSRNQGPITGFEASRKRTRSRVEHMVATIQTGAPLRFPDATSGRSSRDEKEEESDRLSRTHNTFGSKTQVKQATLDGSFGNKTETKTKSLDSPKHRGPQERTNFVNVQEGELGEDRRLRDPRQSRNIVIIKGVVPSKNADQGSSRPTSPDLGMKDNQGSSVEGTHRTNTKKSKRVDVFDKKRIASINKKYLDHTPKLEENLRIHRMAINHPVQQMLQTDHKMGRSAGLSSSRRGSQLSQEEDGPLPTDRKRTSKISIQMRAPQATQRKRSSTRNPETGQSSQQHQLAPLEGPSQGTGVGDVDQDDTFGGVTLQAIKKYQFSPQLGSQEKVLHYAGDDGMKAIIDIQTSRDSQKWMKQKLERDLPESEQKSQDGNQTERAEEELNDPPVQQKRSHDLGLNSRPHITIKKKVSDLAKQNGQTKEGQAGAEIPGSATGGLHAVMSNAATAQRKLVVFKAQDVHSRNNVRASAHTTKLLSQSPANTLKQEESSRQKDSVLSNQVKEQHTQNDGRRMPAGESAFFSGSQLLDRKSSPELIRKSVAIKQIVSSKTRHAQGRKSSANSRACVSQAQADPATLVPQQRTLNVNDQDAGVMASMQGHSRRTKQPKNKAGPLLASSGQDESQKRPIWNIGPPVKLGRYGQAQKIENKAKWQRSRIEGIIKNDKLNGRLIGQEVNVKEQIERALKNKSMTHEREGIFGKRICGSALGSTTANNYDLAKRGARGPRQYITGDSLKHQDEFTVEPVGATGAEMESDNGGFSIGPAAMTLGQTTRAIGSPLAGPDEHRLGLLVNVVGSSCSGRRPRPQTLYDKSRDSPCKCNDKLNNSLKSSIQQQKKAAARMIAAELQRRMRADQLLVGRATNIEETSSSESKAPPDGRAGDGGSPRPSGSLGVAQHADSRTIELGQQQKSSIAKMASPAKAKTYRSSTSKLQREETTNMENSRQLIEADVQLAEPSQLAGSVNIKEEIAYRRSASKGPEGTVASLKSSEDRQALKGIRKLQIEGFKDLGMNDVENSSCFLYEGLTANRDKLVTMREGEAPILRSQLNNTLMQGMQIDRRHSNQGKRLTQSLDPATVDSDVLWTDQLRQSTDLDMHTNRNLAKPPFNMLEILRHMNGKGLRLGSHRESIDSSQIEQLNKSQRGGERARTQASQMSKHAKNKFVSNKERNVLNDLLRQSKFSFNGKDVEKELRQLTNEQLLSAHVDLLPNFGLFCQGDRSSDGSSHTKRRLDLKTQQTERRRSPTLKWQREPHSHRYAVLDGQEYVSPRLLMGTEPGLTDQLQSRIQRCNPAFLLEVNLRSSESSRREHDHLAERLQKINERIFTYASPRGASLQPGPGNDHQLSKEKASIAPQPQSNLAANEKEPPSSADKIIKELLSGTDASSLQHLSFHSQQLGATTPYAHQPIPTANEGAQVARQLNKQTTAGVGGSASAVLEQLEMARRESEASGSRMEGAGKSELARGNAGGRKRQVAAENGGDSYVKRDGKRVTGRGGQAQGAGDGGEKRRVGGSELEVRTSMAEHAKEEEHEPPASPMRAPTMDAKHAEEQIVKSKLESNSDHQRQTSNQSKRQEQNPRDGEIKIRETNITHPDAEKAKDSLPGARDQREDKDENQKRNTQSAGDCGQMQLSREADDVQRETNSRSGVYSRYKGRSDHYKKPHGGDGEQSAQNERVEAGSRPQIAGMPSPRSRKATALHAPPTIDSVGHARESARSNEQSKQSLTERGKTEEPGASLGQIILISSVQGDELGKDKGAERSQDESEGPVVLQFAPSITNKTIEQVLGASRTQRGGDTIPEPRISGEEPQQREPGDLPVQWISNIGELASSPPDSAGTDGFQPLTYKRDTRRNRRQSRGIRQEQVSQGSGRHIVAALRARHPQEVELLSKHYDLESVVAQYNIKDVDGLMDVLVQLQELDQHQDYFQRSYAVTANLARRPKKQEEKIQQELKTASQKGATKRSANTKWALDLDEKGQTRRRELLASPAATEGLGSEASHQADAHAAKQLFVLPQIRLTASLAAPTPGLPATQYTSQTISAHQSTSQPEHPGENHHFRTDRLPFADVEHIFERYRQHSTLDTKRKMLSTCVQANKAIQHAIESQKKHALRRSSVLYEDHSTYQAHGLQRGLLQHQAQQLRAPPKARAGDARRGSMRQSTAQSKGPGTQGTVESDGRFEWREHQNLHLNLSVVDNEVSRINGNHVEEEPSISMGLATEEPLRGRERQLYNHTVQGQAASTSSALESFEMDLLARHKQTAKNMKRGSSFKRYCKHLGTQLFATAKDLERSKAKHSSIDYAKDSQHPSEPSHSRLSSGVIVDPKVKDTAAFRHFKCYLPGNGSLKHGDLRKIDSAAIEGICASGADWNVREVKRGIQKWAAESRQYEL